jgi:hypothetical protein
MKIEGHRVDTTLSVKGSVDGKTATAKVTADKAVLQVGHKEITVERKGHGEYKVKMHHVHHGDHVSKKEAREFGEQAIKAVRKATREVVCGKHK